MVDPISYNLARKVFLEMCTPPYSAIVCKDGSTVWAEDASGKTIASGESGVDDASVIQSAINAIDKGKISLSANDFTLATPIKLKSFISLIGQGPRCTRLLIKEGNTHAIEIYGDSAASEDRVQRVEIRDLSICQASGGIDKNLDGCRIKWAELLYINNVYIDWVGGRGFDIQSLWESFFTNLRIIAGNVDFGTEAVRITDTEGGTVNDSSNHLIFENIIIGGYGRLVTIEGHSNASAPHGITFINVESESPLDSNVDYAYYFNWAYLIKMSQVHNFNIHSNIFYVKDISRLFISDSEFMINNTISGKQGFEISNSRLYLVNSRFTATGRVIATPTTFIQEIKAANCKFTSLESDATYWLQALDKIMFVSCEFEGASGCYGLHVNGADNGCYLENIHSTPNTSIKDAIKNSGTATFSGDGTTTQFSIAHGLVSTPTKVLVTPMTADAASDFYVTADDTNIYINYKSAPPSGTDNLKFSWLAEV